MSTINSTAVTKSSGRTRDAVLSLTSKAQRADALAAKAERGLIVISELRELRERSCWREATTSRELWTDADYDLTHNACLVYQDYLETMLCIGELTAGEVTDDGQAAMADLRAELKELAWLRAYLVQAGRAATLLLNLSDRDTSLRWDTMAALSQEPVEPIQDETAERTLVV